MSFSWEAMHVVLNNTVRISIAQLTDISCPVQTIQDYRKFCVANVRTPLIFALEVNLDVVQSRCISGLVLHWTHIASQMKRFQSQPLLYKKLCIGTVSP